jgi:ubiquinone/menaquinone biosynthesis C-methylase UbiE
VDRLLRATARAEQHHFWFRGFRAFVTPLVRQALGGVAHPRILDCGCGTGANVHWLARFGEAFGFDLTETGLRIGQEAGRRRLVRASVTAVPFPDASFDLVTSFDVLYALADADAHRAVSEMYRTTRPGGYVIVNVAAMDVLRGDHSVLGREVRRYSRPALKSLIAASGLVPSRITYTNASLFPPLLVMRSYQRWRGLAEESRADRDIAVPPAPINAALAAVLAAESRWVRRHDLPFGSSLLCLARRPDA